MDSANFDAIMAELFPSANVVQSSDVTNMPNNGDMLDASFYLLDITSFIPADQLITTSFQSSSPNQCTLPMMSFATSGLWDISNANFINFAINVCDISSHLIQKDDRSIVVGVLISHSLLCANYDLTVNCQSQMQTALWGHQVQECSHVS